MGGVVKDFFKQKTTIIGIATAALFQLIFSVVWMTGYSGVNERTSQLQIAVVNEDAGFGAVLAASLHEQLPFTVIKPGSLTEARDQLEQREVQMVVHIPADFSEAVSSTESKGMITYAMNESNVVTIKNAMASVAQQITATANQLAAQHGVQQTLASMQIAEPQAEALAAGLTSRIEGSYEISNPVPDMADQMVPMMMVLASYVGSMLLGMNLEQSSAALTSRHSKWQRFTARQLINVGTAVIVGLFGVTLVTLLGSSTEHSFLSLWGFQTLFLFAFMTLAQVFLLLFGTGGMVFNIMLLSAQLVSSGAMVPREMLSGFYQGLGDALPATYAVEGLMNLLFGGPSTTAPALALAASALVYLGIGIAVTAVRRGRALPERSAFAAN
ncbi:MULTISPECIES: YhgE/Pip domain-containing protein [Paenibacillus]|uniref:ABC-2 type transporter transmembrane domain-containing protein n=1 Tax=Paenibacillus campinasensis TaxID=66347 RepID=A0A268EW31_9BACL|nr:MULTISPECIES: ABC transporter permease [Paenibacillus]PAD77323.1 hypothetical protein CHH67_09970 [Paenibacillus campinasensis]PAK50335.1 hypothetical protein CHH75_18480 [Paenibacillus sp. 7541]